MNELIEIVFNENRLLLENNLVRSPILPRVSSELERDVVVKANCRVLPGSNCTSTRMPRERWCSVRPSAPRVRSYPRA
jgi:hypothetical protein